MATMGRVTVLTFVVAVAFVSFGGCSGDDAADRPFSELYFRRPATGYEVVSTRRSSTCGRGDITRQCSRRRAEAVIRYQCGETSFYVETWTNALIAPSQAYDQEPVDVKVRGVPGQLWQFGGGDFELIWQERPDVGVRVQSEDGIDHQSDILGFAQRLSTRRWGVPEFRTKKMSTPPDCGPSDGFR
jgi:hypothetical protein